MILVAHYSCFLPHFDIDLTASSLGWGIIRNYRVLHLGISWTMKQAKDAPASFTGSFIRSVYYRSSVTPQYLAIPENGASFFTLFLFATHHIWQELATRSRLYISHNVSCSLISYCRGVTLLISALE